MQENCILPTQPDLEVGLAEPTRQRGGDDLVGTFETRKSRHAFIRKVMTIVSLQALVTVLFLVLCVYNDDVKIFVQSRRNRPILYACFGILLFISMMTCCCIQLFRTFPINMILLLIFTLAESYVVGLICSLKYSDVVVYALGLTVLLCFALVIFATQTKCDFTGFGPYLLVALLIFLVASIVSIFWRARIFLIVLSSFGVLLFSCFLVYDLQLVFSEGRQHQYEEEDYVLAAIAIYMDIIQLFLQILNLLELLMDE